MMSNLPEAEKPVSAIDWVILTFLNMCIEPKLTGKYVLKFINAFTAHWTYKLLKSVKILPRLSKDTELKLNHWWFASHMRAIFAMGDLQNALKERGLE